MADNAYANWEPHGINAEFTHAPSILTEIGDLVYLDSATKTLKPASSFPDAGTAATTRVAFALVFVGVANSKQKADDAVGRGARVLIDQIFEFPCESATFEVGDFVGSTWITTVTSDQSVTKTAVAAEAIGKVVKRYASATTRVKCRLTARHLVGLVRP